MSHRHSLLAALLVAVSLAAACHQQSDDAINTYIKARMFSDPSLKTASVHVARKGGVVKLTGQVPDDAARLSAQRIASHTKGVKQ